MAGGSRQTQVKKFHCLILEHRGKRVWGNKKGLQGGGWIQIWEGGGNQIREKAAKAGCRSKAAWGKGEGGEQYRGEHSGGRRGTAGKREKAQLGQKGAVGCGVGGGDGTDSEGRGART